MQLRRRRLLAPALSYGLARLPQLGTLTTAPHTYHSSACKTRRHGLQFHPFFLRLSSYAHRTRPSYLLSSTVRHRHPHRHRTRRVASYCTTSHCHLESCANNLTKNVDLLAASYSRLSLRPASSSPPSLSTSYSPRRIIQLPPALSL